MLRFGIDLTHEELARREVAPDLKKSLLSASKLTFGNAMVRTALTAWDDATTRLAAASKLKGTARIWHFAFENQHVTLKETFSSELALLVWQEHMIEVRQLAGESLQEHAYAKLRGIKNCAIVLTDAQKTDFLQGLQEPYVVAAIEANSP
ncbi:hypothetical protein HPB50_019471 [Hyalomma asiaticum]|uniref:Uncharacterized protein n=1 Tax=Hyalomma asiaticum TaxID=266040 RepID=A0ACB7S1C7_HYAAI|nr:hypothetical protein HPB50_019471 [Hyalomma asiaticum]